MGRSLLLFFAASLLCPAVATAADNTTLTTLAATTVVYGPLTPEQIVRERTALVTRFAAEKIDVWKNRLELQDWNVTLLVVRSTELKPKTLGNIHWDTEKKTAIIRVLDPADYKLPFSEALQDIEFTVVHELIHLQLSPVLSPLQRNDANRREEEHAVNHMAEALLKLDRQNRAAVQMSHAGTATMTGGENAASASRSK